MIGNEYFPSVMSSANPESGSERLVELERAEIEHTGRTRLTFHFLKRVIGQIQVVVVDLEVLSEQVAERLEVEL